MLNILYLVGLYFESFPSSVIFGCLEFIKHTKKFKTSLYSVWTFINQLILVAHETTEIHHLLTLMRNVHFY